MGGVVANPSASRRPLASSVMTRQVTFVYQNDTIESVADLFIRQHISAAPVLGETGVPIGVISKSDLARYETHRNRRRRYGSDTLIHPGFCLDPEAETIRDWFTPGIVSVHPETPLSRVADKMARHYVHHVFVREPASGRICGVVSSLDIVRKLRL